MFAGVCATATSGAFIPSPNLSLTSAYDLYAALSGGVVRGIRQAQTHLRLRVVELLLVLGNLLRALFNLGCGGTQRFYRPQFGRGGVNLGVRLVELGFCLGKLGGGSERVGDRIHGRKPRR